MELSDWKNRHEGKPFVVLGLGESVALGQWKEIRKDALLIGVNDCARYVQPHFLILANRKAQFTPERWDWIMKTEGQIFFSTYGAGGWEETEEDMAKILNPKPCKVRLRRGLPDLSNPHVLACALTSPYIGVCLAAHMGAKRIGVLGVDFSTPHQFMQQRWKQIDNNFANLRNVLEAAGIELVNLSPVSLFTSMPKVDVSDF